MAMWTFEPRWCWRSLSLSAGTLARSLRIDCPVCTLRLAFGSFVLLLGCYLMVGAVKRLGWL